MLMIIWLTSISVCISSHFLARHCVMVVSSPSISKVKNTFSQCWESVAFYPLHRFNWKLNILYYSMSFQQFKAFAVTFGPLYRWEFSKQLLWLTCLVRLLTQNKPTASCKHQRVTFYFFLFVEAASPLCCFEQTLYALISAGVKRTEHYSDDP